MREKVRSGLWIDREKFEKVTVTDEIVRCGRGEYGSNWKTLIRIQVYEKGNVLIYSEYYQWEKECKAKKLVDEIYEFVSSKGGGNERE